MNNPEREGVVITTRIAKNLGTGDGIELIKLFQPSAVNTSPETSSKTYQLFSNYPNPFNPVTTIRFLLENDAQIHLTIHDITGRHVKTLMNG